MILCYLMFNYFFGCKIFRYLSASYNGYLLFYLELHNFTTPSSTKLSRVCAMGTKQMIGNLNIFFGNVINNMYKHTNSRQTEM